MTELYFIRHAKPDYSVHEDALRPLTALGEAQAQTLVDRLSHIHFDAIYSSPYLRCVRTVQPLANAQKLEVITHDGLRERKVDSLWIEDFQGFAQRQWADFQYKLTDGECLAEVQQRNLAALGEILTAEAGNTIAISTHGTALSVILNHYNPDFGYEDFQRIAPITPYVYHMVFDGHVMISEAEV